MNYVTLNLNFLNNSNVVDSTQDGGTLINNCTPTFGDIINIKMPSGFSTDGSMSDESRIMEVYYGTTFPAYYDTTPFSDINSYWSITDGEITQNQFELELTLSNSNCSSYPLITTYTLTDVTIQDGGFNTWNINGNLEFVVPSGTLTSELDSVGNGDITNYQLDVPIDDEGTLYENTIPITLSGRAVTSDLNEPIDRYKFEIEDQVSNILYTSGWITPTSDTFVGDTLSVSTTIPGYEESENTTETNYKVKLTIEDIQGDSSITESGYGHSNGGVTITNQIYGCMDIQATNYNPNATHNNGVCTFTEPTCDIAFTEIFLTDQPGQGSGDFPIHIPQWLELTNLTGNPINIDGWYLQLVDSDDILGNGLKTNIPLNFLKDTIIPGIGSEWASYFCPSDGSYHQLQSNCEEICGGEGTCNENPQGGKFLIYSNSSDNREGLFKGQGNGAPEFRFHDYSYTSSTIPVPIAYGDFDLPNSDDIGDITTCPSNPWDDLDGDGGGFIIVLYDGDPTDANSNPQCSFCIGQDWMSTNPFIAFGGSSFEYDVYATDNFSNTHLNDKEKWNRNSDFPLFDERGKHLNNILEDIGIDSSVFDFDPDNGYINTGTPLDSNTNYNPSLVTDCDLGGNNLGCCTDPNALDYVCNEGQPYANDMVVCGNYYFPPPYVQCNDGTIGEDSTCCQYQVLYGCNTYGNDNYACRDREAIQQDGSTFTIDDEDIFEYCEDSGNGFCSAENGYFDCRTKNTCVDIDGNTNQACIQDGNFPAGSGGVTWCHEEFVIYMDNIQNDPTTGTGSVDIMLWNSLPVSYIIPLRLKNLNATGFEVNSVPTGFNATVSTDNTNHETDINILAVSNGNYIEPIADHTSYDCNPSLLDDEPACTTGQKILTINFTTSAFSDGFTPSEMSRVKFASPGNDSIWTTDGMDPFGDGKFNLRGSNAYLTIDCDGFPHQETTEGYNETISDNCGVCREILYDGNSMDFEAMQEAGGCFYNQTNIPCDANINGCTDCLGIVSGTATEDCAGYCGHDGDGSWSIYYYCTGGAGSDNECGVSACALQDGGDPCFSATDCTTFGSQYEYCSGTYCSGIDDAASVCTTNSYNYIYCNCNGTILDNTYCDCDGHQDDECGVCNGTCNPTGSGGNSNGTGGCLTCCDGQKVCNYNDCLVVEDECGVCGGNNSPDTGTCDCASVPNGDHSVDFCGDCKLSTDETRNRGCCGTYGYASSASTCTCDATYCSTNCPSDISPLATDFTGCCDDDIDLCDGNGGVCGGPIDNESDCNNYPGQYCCGVCGNFNQDDSSIDGICGCNCNGTTVNSITYCPILDDGDEGCAEFAGQYCDSYGECGTGTGTLTENYSGEGTLTLNCDDTDCDCPTNDTDLCEVCGLGSGGANTLVNCSNAYIASFTQGDAYYQNGTGGSAVSCGSGWTDQCGNLIIGTSGTADGICTSSNTNADGVCNSFSFDTCQNGTCVCLATGTNLTNGLDCNNQCNGPAKTSPYDGSCCLSGNVDICGVCVENYDGYESGDACTGCMDVDANNTNQPCQNDWSINCTIDNTDCELGTNCDCTYNTATLTASITTTNKDDINETTQHAWSSTYSYGACTIISREWTLDVPSDNTPFDYPAFESPSIYRFVAPTFTGTIVQGEADYSEQVTLTYTVTCDPWDDSQDNIVSSDSRTITIHDVPNLGCVDNTACNYQGSIDANDNWVSDGSCYYITYPAIDITNCTNENYLAMRDGTFTPYETCNIGGMCDCGTDVFDSSEYNVYDCSGICGGDTIVDSCGVCNGNNSNLDCNNVCDPSTPQGILDLANGLIYGSFEDDCSICVPLDSPTDGNRDCAGQCPIETGELNIESQCGCVGPNTEYSMYNYITETYITDWCTDCASTPFGVDTQDLCSSCITPLLAINRSDGNRCEDLDDNSNYSNWDSLSDFCGCSDINPCPADHSCVIPANLWWPTPNKGLCYEDWTGACAPSYDFGTFDKTSGQLPIYISVPTSNDYEWTIGRQDLVFKLYTEDDVYIDTTTLQTAIDVPTDSLLYTNCGTSPYISDVQIDSEGYKTYTLTFCNAIQDVAIGEGDTQLLFNLKLSNTAGNDFYIDIDEYESSAYSQVGPRDEAYEFAWYEVNYPYVGYKRVLGCIDPYAINCDARIGDNCGCIVGDVFPAGHLECANENNDTCEYPELSFNDIKWQGVTYSVDEDNQVYCNYNDIINGDCTTLLDTAEFLNKPTLNPLVNTENSGFRDNYVALHHSLIYDFTGLDRTIIDGWTGQHNYTIDEGESSVLNSFVHRKLYVPNDIILGCNNMNTTCTGYGNPWFNQMNIVVGGLVNGTSDDIDIWKSSSIATNYWGTYDTSDTPDGTCGDEYCPYNGDYTIGLEWPNKWWELIDPLTGNTMTSPRVKVYTKFALEKRGCMLSTDDTCNNNPYATHDCNGDEGGSTIDCCTYKSILYGSDEIEILGNMLPTNTINSCCTERDDCGYCPNNTINDVVVHGLNEITYYTDLDTDGVGCENETLSVCIDQCPLNDTTCGGVGIGQGTNDYYQLSNHSQVSAIWGNSVARLTDLESDEMCTCATNVWDTNYCDECSRSCTNNLVTSEVFDGYRAGINEPNSDILDSLPFSSDCLNAGFCVDSGDGGVCVYQNECGICYMGAGEQITVPLDSGSMIVTQSNYRDCNGVCWNDLVETDVDRAAAFGAYNDSSCPSFCIGGNTGLTSGHPDTQDLCGRCLDVSGATCMEVPDVTDNTQCQPQDSQNCYTWQGGCYDCTATNVGIGGLSGYDACCNCGGDCEGSVNDAICGDSVNNDYQVADCFGDCGGTATLDDQETCCYDNEKINLFPDLDSTSIYVNGELFCNQGECAGIQCGTGECGVGGDDCPGGSCLPPNCTTGPYNGCSGEIGFCADFGRTDGNLENPSCPRCSITPNIYCDSDSDCPDTETCTNSVTFFLTNRPSYCVPTDATYPVTISSTQQPDITDNGTLINWTGYYWPNSTDYCLNYGPDNCGQCHDEYSPSTWNQTQDCAGFCSYQDGYGHLVDDCGVCYDPTAPENICDADEIIDPNHHCYGYGVDDVVPENTCFNCPDPLAQCDYGQSGAFGGGNCNYQNTGKDCSGTLNGNDISCCWYPKPTLNVLSVCEGTGDNCEYGTTCVEQGFGDNSGDCIQSIAVNNTLSGEYPITFDINWTADNSAINSDCVDEIFIIERSMDGGTTWDILSNQPVAEDTVTDNLNNVDSIPETIKYKVRTEGECTWAHYSDEYEVNVKIYNTEFTANVVNQDGIDISTFSYSDYLNGTKIWVEVDYKYVPILQGGFFTIDFLDPWSISTKIFTFPTWSNGATDGGYEDVTKYYCPTTWGTEQANGASGGQWEDLNTCNYECGTTCTTDFKVYFDITNDVWNYGCGTDFDFPIEFNVHWPSIDDIIYYGCGPGATEDPTCDINVSSTKGCMDLPSTNGGYWTTGACTCQTCFDDCSACATSWSGIPLDVPSECKALGFYDNEASYDVCVERDGDNIITTETSECCSGISLNTANQDCAQINTNYECTGTCIYPIYGCKDDGNHGTFLLNNPNDGTYKNNQGGWGSVLPFTWKCASQLNDDGSSPCDDLSIDGIADYGSYCDNYYNDETCEGCETSDCLFRPSPAENYNPGATYDVGQCLYTGCIDPDAMNYDVPVTSDEYGCGENNDCNFWVSDAGICIFPFDYELWYRVVRDGSSSNEPFSLIPTGKSENADCWLNYSEIYTCSETGEDCSENFEICDGETNVCQLSTTGGIDNLISSEEDCTAVGGEWKKDPVLIRKAFPSSNANLDLLLKGQEGYDCKGDDSGQVWATEADCNNFCGNFVNTLRIEDPDTYMRTCSTICPDGLTDCGYPSDGANNCPNWQEGNTCTLGYYPALTLECGTCWMAGVESGVWYPSEEFPQETFPFTGNVTWDVEDGNSYTGAYDYPNSCPNLNNWDSLDNVTCNIINFSSHMDYGQYQCSSPSDCDKTTVDKTYTVTITDPRDSDLSVTKKLHVTYIRNDYIPNLECIQYNGQCLNNEFILDAAHEEDYIFPLIVSNEQEADPYYFELEVSSDSNDPGDLNVRINELDQIVFYDLEETGTGTFTVNIHLYQPFPNNNWDSNPPSDLSLYYIGIPGNYQTISYTITLIDSSGPSGTIVPNLVPSFGLSPDTFNMIAIGSDGRATLTIPENFGENWSGYQCNSFIFGDGMICADNNPDNCPLYCNDFSSPCTQDEDCGEAICLPNGGIPCQIVTPDDGGENTIVANPNYGGWLPENTQTIDFNTVWRYDLYIYKCITSECDETNGTATEILFQEFSDWSIDFPFGLDSIPNNYQPPPTGGNNIWTSRFVCPDSEWSTYGDWCGASPINGFGNQLSAQWCCPDEAVCPDGQPCNPIYPTSEVLNPCGQDCACPGFENAEVQENGSDMCIQASDTLDFPSVRDFIESGWTHRFNEPGWYKTKLLAYDLYYSPNPEYLASGTSVGEDERIFEIEYVIPIKQSVPNNYLPWQGINVPSTDLPALQSLGESEELIQGYDKDKRKSLGCFLYSDAAQNKYDDSNLLWSYVVKNSKMDKNPWNIDCAENNNCTELGYDFYPDADIRTPLSKKGEAYEASGEYSTLFYYYDRRLQPIEYNETQAPTAAQFYFYPREYGEIFTEKEMRNQEWFLKQMYVGFIDWGDGSDIEYDDEPIQLGFETVLEHSYERAGTYDIVGRMFLAPSDDQGDVLGVEKHHRFVCRINVNQDTEYESEFKTFGGKGEYDFYPYWDKSVVIGGVSEWSTYNKSIARQLGWVDGFDEPFDLYFKNYGDKLKTEYALAQTSENYIGKDMSYYTGSYAHSGSHYINPDDQINVYTYLNQNPIEISSSLYSGFFTGSIDPNGYLTNFSHNADTKLISYGRYHEIDELGDHLGEIDIGQVRYFRKPLDMWQMLGFKPPQLMTTSPPMSDSEGETEESNMDDIFTEALEWEHPGNPGSIKYWNNIIPKNYTLNDRQGVNINPQNGKIEIDESSPQLWKQREDNSYPYYPVLYKANRFGVPDINLGYQGNRIPFPTDVPSVNIDYQSKDLQINLDFSEIKDSSIEDKGGTGYKGRIIGDYKVKFEKNTRIPDLTDTIIEAKIGEEDDTKKPY